jgi:monoamine oxidase
MSGHDVIIIGAGLTGLTLHRWLEQAGFSVLTLEARERVGGRIWTTRTKGLPPIEMGATWLGGKHTELLSLLRELKIATHQQYLGGQAIYEGPPGYPAEMIQLPTEEEPSFRIEGGSDTVIQALYTQLKAERVQTQQQVVRLSIKAEWVRVETTEKVFTARRVVSTVPPRLLQTSIAVEPELPREVTQVMAATHTWMGESIKFGVAYENPFWRDPETTGTLFSNRGPISEMYDHSSPDSGHYALKGFLDTRLTQLSREDRKRRVLTQLRAFYGVQVDRYLDYRESVWAEEPFTYSAYPQPILPHQNNGSILFRQPFWSGKLFIGGSETADRFPGYMDGAVRSARWIFAQLNQAKQ